MSSFSQPLKIHLMSHMLETGEISRTVTVAWIVLDSSLSKHLPYRQPYGGHGPHRTKPQYVRQQYRSYEHSLIGRH